MQDDLFSSSSPLSSSNTYATDTSRDAQEIILKTMMNKLHQALYQHLLSCNMPKTAASLFEESKYFPEYKGSSVDEIPMDTLFRCWSLMMLSKPEDSAFPMSSSLLPVKVEPGLESDASVQKKQQRTSFKCNFPGCTSSFSTMANMKRHEKLHSGDKPYICSHEGCGKKFARKYDMKIHMRIHTKEKPYLCDICSKRFSRISSLREHERNLHQVDNAKKRSRCDYECEEEYSEGETIPQEKEEEPRNLSIPLPNIQPINSFNLSSPPIPSASISDPSDLLPLNLPSFDDFLSSMDPLEPKDI